MEHLNSSVVTSNTFSAPSHLPHLPLNARGVAPAVVLSLCFLLGFPGNIAVTVLKPWQHLSILSQNLMLNLAVSDLLSLVTLPLWSYSLLYSWTFSLVACKLLAYLVYCSICSSLLTVMVLSIQRYLQVVQNRRLLLRKGARMVLLILLWLVAMILSTPYLVVQQLITHQNRTSCKHKFSSDSQRLALLLTEFTVGFTSCCIIAFTYFRLCRKVTQAAFFSNPPTIRLFTSIIMAYFSLWLPYHALNILGVAAIALKNEGLMKFFKDTGHIVTSLTFVNSCLNPILYAFNSEICQKSKLIIQKLRVPKTLPNTLGATAPQPSSELEGQ
ncbi:C3a anaphylatoxin chemotactic receptor-like [Pholidichthys leucotaenia]